MRMIEGIPQVISGVAYYPHIKVPTPNYQKTANGYEINLAVADDVFQKFKDAGLRLEDVSILKILLFIFTSGKRMVREKAIPHHG